MYAMSPYLGDPSSMREKKTKLFVGRTEGAAIRDDRDGTLPSPGPLEAEVARSVLDMLGIPPRLYRVVVRRVVHLKFRANVFIGAGAGIFRVAHSFFLEVNTQGKIIDSSPDISRMYGRLVE
jgi:hypothetical protein